MLSLVLRRLVQSIPALLGVTLVAFVLIQASGDVTTLMLPLQTPKAERVGYRQAHGLDQPIPVQYLHYLGSALDGNFGRSFVYGSPALNVVLEHLPSTLVLAATGMLSVQEIAVKAALECDRNAVFAAVQVDPLAASVLTLAEMRTMTDELLALTPSSPPEGALR